MSTEFIKSTAFKYFDNVGIAAATKPGTIDKYVEWLNKGYQGKMNYLKTHLAKKADPQILLKDSKSWIMVTLNYDTSEPLYSEIQDQLKENKKGWIARYVRGGDYHEVISKKLESLLACLRAEFPNEAFIASVDINAVLERDTAFRAGLGWPGKNTCLIDKERGSFFFIAEILTTLELIPDKPVMDHCGSCMKCIEACPTGALEEPRVLNATKCISYWTIESKLPAVPELASKFGQNIFGCDICQDVCPWNQKARKTNLLPDPLGTGIVDLRDFLKLDEMAIVDFAAHSSMNRTKPAHLLENVKVALENSEL